MINNTENDKLFWLNTRDQIQGLLDSSIEILDSDSIEAVQHYIDHDEYEMAFEGLFIELMGLGNNSENLCCNEFVSLGRSLKLDKESTLIPFFWNDYMQYCKKCS